MPAASDLEIYCPRCYWVPDGGAHWVCNCGCVWNTFDTAAVCPQCQHRWHDTGCPPDPGGCGRFSPHIDWYHGLDALVEELAASTLATPAPSRSDSAHHATPTTSTLR